MHDSGGNYHIVIQLYSENGKHFKRCLTTCEYADDMDFEECSYDDIIYEITSCTDWIQIEGGSK